MIHGQRLRRIGGGLVAALDKLARLLIRLLIRFNAWRRRQSPFWQHVIGNLGVGLLIAVLLLFLHGALWLQAMEDAGIGWVMRMYRLSAPERAAVPFALLDIDERTYRAWGEPFYTPRDRLLKLIRYAVQGRAALVVVDVDLSQRGHDAQADAALQGYLENYGKAGEPPLILARAFREPLDPETHRSERFSFLEGVVSASARLHWGSPLFVLDRNGLLRRWRLWEVVCREGKPAVVPSIQLLSVVLSRHSGEDPGQTAQRLKDKLGRLAQADCEALLNAADHGHGASEKVNLDGLTLSARPDALAQRIVYALPWRLGEGESYPTLRQGNAEVPLLAVRSALPVTEGDSSPATDWLAGRLVVIGASFAESRDGYFTPLGWMPGALVLINAVHSLNQYGEIVPPPWYIKLLIEAALIVVMSFAFAWFDSFWGMLACGVVIILVLLPVSFMVFKSGVWLDFAIPLVAVYFHHLAEQFEEGRHRRRGGHG